MRFNRALLGWGLFLVLLGAVPLAVRAGLVPPDVAGRAWQLWPLLLVAIGLSVIARGSSLENLAGLAIPAVFGLMLGGLLAGGGIPFGGCAEEGEARPFEAGTGTFGETATVEIELGCADVVAVEGNDWRVAGIDADGEGPRVEADSGRLEVRPRGGFRPFGERERWQIEIPTTPRLTLDAALNAGEARLDLRGANLGPVSLAVNAGDARLDLSQVGSVNGPLGVDVNAGEAVVLLPELSMSGEVGVNAGSLILCTPQSAGLRITTNENITAGFDFSSRGLVRNGNTWETPGFAEAAVRIELRADANAGSIALDRQPACATQAQG